MEGGFRIYNVEPLSEKARVGKFLIIIKLYMIYIQCPMFDFTVILFHSHIYMGY